MTTYEEHRARFAEDVQVSARLSCGCTSPKSAPIKMHEACVWPGTVVICDRHEEYAVVVRVSTYLADIEGVRRIAAASGLDEGEQAGVMALTRQASGSS